MNRVCVPSTWPEARPLATSRWQARIWRTMLRPGKVLVPPLVLGMHGPGGHGDRAGHIAAADTVPFPVTWRKMPSTGRSLRTLLFFSRTSELGPSYLAQLANQRPPPSDP